MEQKLFECILTLMKLYNETDNSKLLDAIASLERCIPTTACLEYSLIPLIKHNCKFLGYYVVKMHYSDCSIHEICLVP